MPAGHTMAPMPERLLAHRTSEETIQLMRGLARESSYEPILSDRPHSTAPEFAGTSRTPPVGDKSQRSRLRGPYYIGSSLVISGPLAGASLGDLGIFFQQSDTEDEDEPDRFPEDVERPLRIKVEDHLAEDDKAKKAEAKLKKQDVKDEDCDCLQWWRDWATTQMKLKKLVRGKKVATVSTHPPGQLKKGQRDETKTEKVVIKVYDVYTYAMEGTWRLWCKVSNPEDCADGWGDSGTWKGEFTVEIEVDEYTEDVKYKLSEGISEKDKKKIESKYSEEGENDRGATGDVPQGEWPSGSTQL